MLEMKCNRVVFFIGFWVELNAVCAHGWCEQAIDFQHNAYPCILVRLIEAELWVCFFLLLLFAIIQLLFS